jgi:hypothetical protein
LDCEIQYGELLSVQAEVCDEGVFVGLDQPRAMLSTVYSACGPLDAFHALKDVSEKADVINSEWSGRRLPVGWQGQKADRNE